jgi:LysM repeat protein
MAGQALNIPMRIRFATGGTAAMVQGQLGANSKHTYLLNAGANQILEVTLSGPSDLTLAILGADGSTLRSASSNLTFRGVLPKTQDYILVLASGSAANYSLSLDIPVRIRFASGSTSATLTGTVPATLSQFFILRAAKGQTLNVTATPNDRLQLSIYGFDGSVLRSGMAQGASFNGILPSTQDYILVLKSANQVQAFTLKVSIPVDTSVPVSGTNSYTVQSRDTLLSIARRFNTTVAVLLRANPGITNANVLSVGQIIYLPGAKITLSNGQVIYIAKSGDSMASIARQFNTTLNGLTSANPQISNPNLIFTGQRINIP